MSKEESSRYFQESKGKIQKASCGRYQNLSEEEKKQQKAGIWS